MMRLHFVLHEILNRNDQRGDATGQVEVQIRRVSSCGFREPLISLSVTSDLRPVRKVLALESSERFEDGSHTR